MQVGPHTPSPIPLWGLTHLCHRALHLNPIWALQYLWEEEELLVLFSLFPDEYTKAQLSEAIYSMACVKSENKKRGREPGWTCQWAGRVVLAPTRSCETAATLLFMDLWKQEARQSDLWTLIPRALWEGTALL